MTFNSRKRPVFGSTDWAAQQFMRMLDRDDRLKQARAGAEPVTQTAQSPEEKHEQEDWEFTPERRQALIDAIIGGEGGYVNRASDPGGPTNFGITRDIIDDFNAGRPAAQRFTTPIGRITHEQASRLYDAFISKHRLDEIDNPDIRAQVIDMAINMGIENTGRLLLDELESRRYDVGRAGVDPTSEQYNVVGSRTRGTLNELQRTRDVDKLRAINNALARRRVEYYASDPHIGKTNREDHLTGWLRRARSFLDLPTGRVR